MFAALLASDLELTPRTHHSSKAISEQRMDDRVCKREVVLLPAMTPRVDRDRCA
jgi:hypothetical protein